MARAATKSAAAYLADQIVSRPTVSVEDQTTIMVRVMAIKQPIAVDDVTEDESVNTVSRGLVKKHGFHAVAAVPLLANERALGVLMVYDKRVRRFTEDEVSLLSAFADQAAYASRGHSGGNYRGGLLYGLLSIPGAVLGSVFGHRGGN